MSWLDLIDIDGRSVRWSEGAFHDAPVDRQQGTAVRVLSNYSGAPMGVDVLPARTAEYGFVIERRLRDAGITDGVTQVLVHRVEKHGDLARIFFTAAPVDLRLAYQQAVERNTEHLAVLPLGQALLGWLQHERLDDQVLLILHGETIELIVYSGRSVVLVERVSRYGDDPAEIERQAQQLTRTLLEADRNGKNVPRQATLFQHGPRAEKACAQIVEALQRDAGIDTHTLAPLIGPLNGQEWASSLYALHELTPLTAADNTAGSKALLLAERSAPAAAVLVLLLNLVFGGLALSHWNQARALNAELEAQGGSRAEQELVQHMRNAIEHADRLSQVWEPALRFIALQDRARAVPDLATLMQDVRESAPAGLHVTEVGVISNDKSTLIIVAGKGRLYEGSIADEQKLVELLSLRGYEVVKRQIDAASGDNAFELALSWKGH